MKTTVIWLALPILLISTALSAEELFLEAEKCGDAIRKKQVTVVDVREMSGDIDTVSTALWEQLGPFSMIRAGEVTPQENRSASKTFKNERRSAADLGCDVLIISDTTRLASMASNRKGVANHGDDEQMVALYGCRWSVEIQPDCPIPEEVLEEFERQQMNRAD